MVYIRELDDESVSFGDLASNLSLDVKMAKRDQRSPSLYNHAHSLVVVVRLSASLTSGTCMSQHGGQHQDPRVQLFWIVGAWQLHGIFFVVPPPNGFRQA